MNGATCVDCNGRCCNDVAVGITGYDAWRIASAHAIPFETFVTVASAEARDLGAFRLHDGFAALVLRRSEREERACAFLLQLPDGVRRCGTYASRPTVCRTYPMTLVERGDVALRTGVACPPGAWDMPALDARSWRDDLLAYDAEWDVYARAIAVWNASTLDGLAAYHAYVACAYETIARSGESPLAFTGAIARVSGETPFRL